MRVKVPEQRVNHACVKATRLTNRNGERRKRYYLRLLKYVVPAIFITLNELPHNPDGKIDKPNPPFLDIAGQTGEASNEN
jgi:hypothetical protein